MREAVVLDAVLRKCKRCGVEKALSEYPKGKTRKDGRHSYCLVWFAAYKRDWYVKNREKEVARSQAYNREHWDRHLEKMREYHAKPDVKARVSEYRRVNRERYIAHHQKKRLKRLAVARQSVGVTADQWQEIIDRCDGRCAYCGNKGQMTMDHRTPLARGGLHEPSNVIPACQKCNAKKHALTEEQFAARIGRLI